MAKKETKNAQLGKITARDFSGGVQSRTLPALSDDNQFIHVLNAVFGKKIGSIVGRDGTSVVQDVSDTINNLFVQRNASGARIYFYIRDNGTYNNVYYNTTGFDDSFTLGLSGNFESSGSVFMTSFAGYTFFFNGEGTPKKFDGSTFTDAATNCPSDCKYPAVFNQALWALTEDGWLWYSDVINSTGTDFTSDEWYSIGINPVDGQYCKALKRHRGYLVIFKDDSIYRYDGSTADPEAIINIGTPSERGIVQTDYYMYFFNPKGIYRMLLGDPACISRGVKKYIDGMSTDYWESVSSGKDSRSSVYFHIGDVTINNPLEWDYGTTYNDVCLVWDYELEVWSVFSNVPADIMFFDIDDGTLYFTDDTIIKKFDNTVFNDCDEPIDFQAMWHPIDYGIPQSIKTVSHILAKTSPNISLIAGGSPEKMEHSSRYDSNTKVSHIRQEISFSELWIQAHESYDDLPPHIDLLQVGNANARDII